MGASQRKDASAYFSDFATAATPPTAEAFAAQLTRYSTGLCSGSEFFSVAGPVVRQLIARNAETGRLAWLLDYTCRAFAPVAVSAQGADPTQLAALRVTELTLRHVLALGSGDSARLLAMLGSTPKAAATTATASGEQGNPQGNPAGTLCGLLMDYVVKVTVDTATAPAHAAVARLLLTMTSSALYHDTRFREDSIDVFTEMIMSSKSLGAFLSVLLDRTVAWGAGVGIESSTLYAEGCEPGIGNLFRMFGGGSRTAGGPAPVASSAGGGRGGDGGRGVNNSTGTGSSGGDSKAPPPFFNVTSEPRHMDRNVYASCPTAELTFRHSASLLAVLVAHQKGNGRNPALEYLATLPSTPALSYPAILTALANLMPSCPAVCMIFYVLLNDNPSFLHDTLRSSQVAFMEAVEKVLLLTHMACVMGDASSSSPAAAAAGGAMATPSGEAAVEIDEDPLQLDSLGRIQREMTQYAYPFINFMTSTLLLILSQDRVVGRLLSDGTCVTSFGVDRHQRTGTRMAAASLALQVLCTGTVKAVNDRNEPLAAVFVPCMANLAVFTHDMDTHTAQRIVSLLLIVLRKLSFVDRALGTLAKPETAPQATGKRNVTNPYAAESAEGLAALGDMLIRQLRMIVEVMEGMLRGCGRRNEAFVYELLYERDRVVGAAGADSSRNGAADIAGGMEMTVSSSVVAASDGAAQAPGTYATQAREVVKNLSSLILGFEAEIASAASASSPAEIMAIIRRCSEASGDAASGDGNGVHTTDGHLQPSFSGEGAAASADLLYSYEESPHSYDFFGPFVWASLLSDGRWPGGVLWATKVGALPLFPR